MSDHTKEGSEPTDAVPPNASPNAQRLTLIDSTRHTLDELLHEPVTLKAVEVTEPLSAGRDVIAEFGRTATFRRRDEQPVDVFIDLEGSSDFDVDLVAWRGADDHV